ncbi:MAG: hypothetical protein K2Q06_10575 [Parvularculaceae bacterium]|nr:hypothetical protein [Parvularculaceae bacterium]
METFSADSEVGERMEPALGGRRATKWFGLTLFPYDDAFRDAVAALAAAHFPGALAEEVAARVRAYRMGFFVIATARQRRFPEPIGFTAFLPLSEFGVRLIEFDLFDGADLSDDALAPDFAKAAALYWWATVAEGPAFHALPLVELALSRPPFVGKDIYSTAGTPRGLNAMLRLGFAPYGARNRGVVGGVLARPALARGAAPHGEGAYA